VNAYWSFCGVVIATLFVTHWLFWREARTHTEKVLFIVLTAMFLTLLVLGIDIWREVLTNEAKPPSFNYGEEA
jgi:hypothetical protein